VVVFGEVVWRGFGVRYLEVSRDRRCCLFCWIEDRGMCFAGFFVFQQNRFDSVFSQVVYDSLLVLVGVVVFAYDTGDS